MAKPDRLSALIARFDLRASVTISPDQANLFLLQDLKSGELDRIEFWPVGVCENRAEIDEAELMIAAQINLGGEANPLARALPARVSLRVEEEGNLKDLALLLLAEMSEQRCGRATTLQRLFEVMVVILLRKVMRQHADRPGMISGLADVQISKAMVAIHEQPEFDWRIEDLADRAGLSRSQFMQRFKRCVGQTPAQYLREWRLSLAHQDLAKGEKVKRVAMRYCYSSQEALSRAFSQRYNLTPAQVRQYHLVN